MQYDFHKLSGTSLVRKDPFIVGYTDLTDKSFYTPKEYGEWEYKELNPVLTQEVCQALAYKNCRHCYNRGVQHFNNHKKVRYMKACYCVQNSIDKMDSKTKHKLLFH
jgi:hypothetical protein